MTTKQKMGLAAAGLMLAGGITGGFVVHAANQDHRVTAEAPATNPNQGTNTNSATTTTETAPATKAETVPTVANLEIPANQTPEQTAQTIVARLNTLENTGMNSQTFKQFHADFMEGKADDSWETNYVAPYLDAYFTALCGPDYKSNPNLQWFVNQYSMMAATHLEYYNMTMTDDYPKTGKGVGGLPVYQYSETPGKLVSAENGTYAIGTHDTSNSSETNLVNTPNKVVSSNVYGILTCKTQAVTDDSGKNVLRITSVNYKATDSNY